MKKWLYFKSVFVMILIAFSVLKANEIPHETIVENPKKEITTVESQKLKENAKIEISVNKKNVIEIPWREDKKNIVFTLPEEVKEGEEILFLDSLEDLNSSPSKETKKFNRFKRTTNSNSLPTKKIEYKVEGKNNVQAAKESAKSKSVLVKRDALTGKISGVYSRKGRNSYIHHLGAISVRIDNRLEKIIGTRLPYPNPFNPSKYTFIYDTILGRFHSMVYLPFIAGQETPASEYDIGSDLFKSHIAANNTIRYTQTKYNELNIPANKTLKFTVRVDGLTRLKIVNVKTPIGSNIAYFSTLGSYANTVAVDNTFKRGNNYYAVGYQLPIAFEDADTGSQTRVYSKTVYIQEELVDKTTGTIEDAQTYTYDMNYEYVDNGHFEEFIELTWDDSDEIIFNPRGKKMTSELVDELKGTSKLRCTTNHSGLTVNFQQQIGLDGQLLVSGIKLENGSFSGGKTIGLKYICDKFTFEITPEGKYKFVRNTKEAIDGTVKLSLLHKSIIHSVGGHLTFRIKASGFQATEVNSKIKVDKRIFNNRVSNELFLNTNGSMAKSLSDLNNMQFSPYNYKSLIETTGNPIAGSISFKNIEDNGWKTIGTPNIFGVYGTASTHIGKNSIALKLNEQNTQDYLKENIYWGLNDITNSSIDLSSIKLESKDSAYKLGVALSVDSMESSIGTGKINLSKAKMNEVNIFSKDGIGEVVSDKNPNLKLNITGKMPQTSSYGGANIVNKLRITGTKNAEVSGTSYENENYKLMLNAAGNFEITKKSDNAYQDTLKIEYIYEDVVLGEFTLEIENYNFKLQIVGDDFIDLGSMLKGETQKIDGKLKVKLDSGSSGYTKIVKAEVDKTFMHELKNEASGETLLYKVNTSTNQTGDEVPVNISIEMTPNNNLAVGKYSGFLNLIITIE